MRVGAKQIDRPVQGCATEYGRSGSWENKMNDFQPLVPLPVGRGGHFIGGAYTRSRYPHYSTRRSASRDLCEITKRADRHSLSLVPDYETQGPPALVECSWGPTQDTRLPCSYPRGCCFTRYPAWHQCLATVCLRRPPTREYKSTAPLSVLALFSSLHSSCPHPSCLLAARTFPIVTWTLRPGMPAQRPPSAPCYSLIHRLNFRPAFRRGETVPARDSGSTACQACETPLTWLPRLHVCRSVLVEFRWLSWRSGIYE